ncbi:MAG: hypothetical protein IKF78_05110 [Atopobiaceae bacterium]|nr:hypothetical protein [Atopobiaceae bacterium]
MDARTKTGWLRLIAPYIGVVVGIAVLASPVLADLIESWRANQTISQTRTAVEHVPASRKAWLLEQAHAYNERLVTHASSADVVPYEQQLSWDGTNGPVLG